MQVMLQRSRHATWLLAAGLGVALILVGLWVPLMSRARAADAPSITIDGPTSVDASTPTTITVTGQYSSAGVRLAVRGTRHTSDDATESVVLVAASATSAADGSYSATVSVPTPGYWTFTAAALASLTPSAALHVTATGTTLSLTAPNVFGWIDQDATLTGRIGYYIGRWSGAPTTIQAEVKAPGADSYTVLAPLTTTVDGAFSITNHQPSTVGIYLYRFTWAGDADHAAMTVNTYIRVDLVFYRVVASITPVTATGLDDLTISGTVSLADGTRLIAPQTVTVGRGNPDDDVTLTPVTTAADGTFSFTDHPPTPGTWVYRLRTEESSDHPAGSLVLSRIVTYLPTSITAAVAPDQQPALGQPLTLTGTVTFDQGPAVSAPVPLQVTRGGDCAYAGLVVDQQYATAADGSFSIKVYPGCPGASVLTIRAQPGGIHANSSTTVDITTAKGPVTAAVSSGHGGPVTVGAGHVSVVVPWGLGVGTYKLYATPRGGTKKFISHGAMTYGIRDSSKAIAYTYARTTTFTVVYSGDDGLLAGSASGTVLVKPRSNASVTGGYDTKKSVRRFHVKQAPKLVADIAPGRSGKKLHLVVQRKVGSTWKQIWTGTYTQSKHGLVTHVWRVTHKAGQQYRVRAVWAGDTVLAATKSSWARFAFTK